MNFVIKDESGMTQDELETTRLAIIEYLKLLTPWNFGDSEITISQGDGVPVYITNRNRIISGLRYLSGYHSVENGSPVIYINPKRDRFGYFRAGKPAVPAVPATPYIPARKVLGITIPARPPKVARAAIPARPDIMRGGQLSTIAHEVSETLANPFILNYSNPDEQGRIILKEIVDPVHGQNYRQVINGVNCILPNTCYPNWYEVGSPAPYDVLGLITKPFQLAPKTGYANEVIMSNIGRIFKRI